MAIEIGSLLIDMRADVARLAQDMGRAKDTVDGAMAKIQRAAGAATTALGLIGAGVSVAGMANVVRHAIDAVAALDDMAEKTGASVENLSALADVATIGGHQLATVESGMVRLSKALAGGDDEAKAAGHALAALGLKAEDLRKMDTAEAMLAVAKALDQYADSGGKTALVMDLLGKNGAALLPFLKDLAEKGELNAKVTTQQAAEAEKLQKQVNELKVAQDDLGRALSSITVPALLKVIENFKAAREAGFGFFQSITGLGVRGLGESIGDARANAGKRMNELREEIAGLEADRDRQLKFGAGDSAASVQVAINNAQQRLKYYQAMQRAALAEQFGGDQYLDARDLAARQKGDLRGYEPADKSKKAKTNTDLERMLKRGQENLAASLDSEEEMAKIAQKRDADEAKRHADRLRHFEEIAQARELEAYYATAGEETVREEMEKTNRAMAKQDGLAKDLGFTFASAFEDAVLAGKEFSDVLRGLAQDIGRMLLRKAVTEPMANSIGGWLDKVLPKFAEGGDHSGGLRLVGERGMELEATGPARIFNAEQTRAILAGGASAAPQQSFHFSIDARGAEIGVEQRIAGAVKQAVTLAVAAVQQQANRGGSYARDLGRR